MEQVLKLHIDEKIRNELAGSRCVAANYNRSDGWIYVTHESDIEKQGNDIKEGWNSINMKGFNRVIDDYQKGKLSESEYLDKINIGVFNIKDGWQDRANEWYSNQQAAIASGEISVPDYSGIEVSAMTAIIYGLEERVHTLQNALRQVNIEGTRYEYPELTSRVTISRNINYGDDIPVKSVGIANRLKNLKCDAAHFKMYDNVRYRPHSVDPWNVNLQAIGLAFIRDTATQVYELLTDSSITNVTGTDWQDNTKQPYIDIAKAIDPIETGNGMPDRIALHDLALAAFRGNTNTKTIQMTSQPDQYGAKVLPEGTLYAGLQTFVDNFYNHQKATVWSSFYVPMVLGSQGVAQYRDVPRFANGYLTFQWKLLFIADLTKIRTISPINGL